MKFSKTFELMSPLCNIDRDTRYKSRDVFDDRKRKYQDNICSLCIFPSYVTFQPQNSMYFVGLFVIDKQKAVV